MSCCCLPNYDRRRSNIIIHPTRANNDLFLQDSLRAVDDERTGLCLLQGFAEAMAPPISDEELNERILALDNELIDQGFEPWQREIHIESKLSQELQISYIISNNDQPHHVRLIRQYLATYYRKEDLFMPPLHIGAFLFRDLFFPIRIPVIFGSPIIDLRKFLCQATESQAKLIFGERKSTLTFFDQAFDLLDFVYGLDDLGKQDQISPRSVEWWNLAKQQLEAASATTLGSFTKYVIVQNCCVSAELLLKGALLQEGIDEDLLSKSHKGFGHNLESMARKACEFRREINSELVLAVVASMPSYVETRYNDIGLTRVQLGHLLMSTQFMAGEILRCYSDRNFKLTARIQERTYPSFTSH
jgi:hypothetical protein